MPVICAPKFDASGGSVRIRMTLVGLLVVGTAAGCTSDSQKSDPYCQQLSATSERLASAQQDLYQVGAGSKAALNQIVGELQGLQTSAPADIRTALSELVTAFQQADDALRQPTKRAQRQLAQAAKVLAADGKKLTDYVASKCE